MFNNSNNAITGGSFVQHNYATESGLRDLAKVAVMAATHDSGEEFARPQCHPRTREKVLERLMDWVVGNIDEDKWMKWLSGGAGAGKSTIAQTLALRCVQRNLLLGSFFFFRADSRRSTIHSLAATLAYQAATYVPALKPLISAAVEQDPLIFEKSLAIQFDALLISPIDTLRVDIEARPSPFLIIIDGLDECEGSKQQRGILEVLSAATRRCRWLRILVASRPETEIRTSFRSGPPSECSTRLALDDTYKPDDDIHLFLIDTFNDIKTSHQSKEHIPSSWPSNQAVKTLVEKSSGQFIYASTVAKYIASACDDPLDRLEVILGLRPNDSDDDLPFAQLDALYFYILSSVPKRHFKTMLDVLGLLVFITLGDTVITELSLFLSLPERKLEQLFASLSSVLTVTDDDLPCITHASLPDYLSDKQRSKQFYLNEDVVYADTAYRCVKHLTQSLDKSGVLTAAELEYPRHRSLELISWVVKHLSSTDSLTSDLRGRFLGIHLKKLWLASTDRLNLMVRLAQLVDNIGIDPSIEVQEFLHHFQNGLSECLHLLLQNFNPDGPEMLLTTLLDIDLQDSMSILAAEIFGIHYVRYENTSLGCLDCLSGPPPRRHMRLFLYNFFCDPSRGPYIHTGSRYAKAAIKCYEYVISRKPEPAQTNRVVNGVLHTILPKLLERSSSSRELITILRSPKVTVAHLLLRFQTDYDPEPILDASRNYLQRNDPAVETLGMDPYIGVEFMLARLLHLKHDDSQSSYKDNVDFILCMKAIVQKSVDNVYFYESTPVLTGAIVADIGLRCCAFVCKRIKNARYLTRTEEATFRCIPSCLERASRSSQLMSLLPSAVHDLESNSLQFRSDMSLVADAVDAAKAYLKRFEIVDDGASIDDMEMDLS